jgi:hypothetical protein
MPTTKEMLDDISLGAVADKLQGGKQSMSDAEKVKILREALEGMVMDTPIEDQGYEVYKLARTALEQTKEGK